MNNIESNTGFQGKKLLILAGAELHCKVVETAKEMGIYTIVTDYLPDSPAKKIADEAWLLDIFDVDGIVEHCLEEKVDGVLTFCIDPAQRPYQKICERLNVPCFCTEEQITTMTDKKRFKEFCVKNGVDVVSGITEEQLNKNEVDYPVLVKPAISRGSRGQKVCHTLEEVQEAMVTASNESRDGKAVIEKYMKNCQDFSVSYLVVAGRPYITKIGDRYLGLEKDNLDKQCIATISPSKYLDIYMDTAAALVEKMIQQLGIKFGPIFLQGFIDNGMVKFYDPGIRMPGGDFDLLLRKETGFDTIKSVICFSLTGDIHSCFGNPVDAYKLNSRIGIQLTLSAAPGQVKVFEGFDEIEKIPQVISVSRRCKVGDVIPASGDIRQRVVEILLSVRDSKEAISTINEIYSLMKVLNKDGGNMMVSLLNTDVLLDY